MPFPPQRPSSFPPEPAGQVEGSPAEEASESPAQEAAEPSVPMRRPAAPARSGSWLHSHHDHKRK